MKKNKFGFLIFVIGLFSITQVRLVGSIGISELVIFFMAPFVLISNMTLFRRDGCMKFIWLCGLALVGCAISTWYNHINIFNFLRGFATPYGFFASFIVLYPILRKDPSSFSWYLVGATLSMTISSFAFQSSYELIDAESRGGGVEGIMSGPIFWISRIGPYVSLLPQAFYLATPLLYSIFAPLAFSAFALFSSASGRSAAFLALAAATMIAYARKDRKKMMEIRKHFIVFILGAMVFVFAFKSIYSALAESGRLGEVAQSKFESQTRGGKDILHLVMGGRGEFFLGIYYAFRRPIMGYGPWAIDTEGIYLDYLKEYGLQEDYDNILLNEAGGHIKYHIVGAHSAMLQFWLAYGILGLPVWIYLIFLIFDYFRRRIGVIPEFFGYFSFVLPTMMWSICFSPFGGRMNWGFMVAMLLLNRVMSQEREALRH